MLTLFTHVSEIDEIDWDLDCASLRTQKCSLSPVSHLFNANNISTLTSFFFLFQNEKSLDEVSVPESLYRQTALMIQHGVLDLDSIYGLLGPDDEDIFAAADAELSDAREFVRKMNIVSLKDKETEGGKDDKNKTAELTEMDVMAENVRVVFVCFHDSL